MIVIRAIAFLLAFFSVLATLLAIGGFVSDRLDVLTHFTPFFLAGGLLALALALISGPAKSVPIQIIAGVAIAGCLFLMGPDVIAAMAPRAAAGGQTLKIVQSNLWAYNRDPAGTAAWIAAQNADIVVMEEAEERGGDVVTALMAHYPYRTPCGADGDCSTVILSKIPPSAAGAGARPSMVWARFGTGEAAFTVVGTHTTWPTPAGPQQAQSRNLAALFNQFDRKTLIVAGDFNSTPWSFSLRRQDQRFGLQRVTRALFTWPTRRFDRLPFKAPFPFLAIDHVYAGQAWRTVSVRRGPTLGSDHYPVVAVLTRPKPPASSK